jgi:hypothetical protein
MVLPLEQLFKEVHHVLGCTRIGQQDISEPISSYPELICCTLAIGSCTYVVLLEAKMLIAVCFDLNVGNH